MNPTLIPGLVRIRSRHSVEEVLARLTALLDTNGVKLFAVIDHSGEAAGAGLTMPPTKLVVFGNPQAGTPLMVAVPSIAIDLPLKLLIAEDPSGGGVTVSYNSPAYLRERHQLPADLVANIAAIEVIARKVAE
jgi:uncharacterized protein (DUF302 family)